MYNQYNNVDHLILPNNFSSTNNSNQLETGTKCGSGLFRFIPDKILGVNIETACEIHDFMYERGGNHDDKKLADRLFYYNLMLTMDEHSSDNIFLDLSRKLISIIYSLGPVIFGGFFFYKNK